MPSCSVHHCVLFLLTLTFTTDPASAAVFPLYAKLHQPVTLPCESSCGGVAMWNLISNRDVVFARCNETSCRSLKDGYEMSHTRYKKGDLSLTITKPDYSMRETYACECGTSDYAAWSLRMSTVSSAVHVSPGEDLKLDLSVPEPVEVIYRGSDSADGEQICNVTKRSLQCKAKYTPRTSLSYPELTLRDLGRSEGGTYTIRNLDYEEEIRVYDVSVSGLYTWETAVIVIVVLLLAGLLAGLLVTGVMMYMKRKAEREKEEAVRKSREMMLQMGEVDDLIQHSESKPPGEEREKEELLQQVEEKERKKKLLQQVKEKIEALEKKYGDDREHSGDIRLFCRKKRNELERIKQAEFLYFRGRFMTRTEVVMTILQELESQVSKRSISDQQRSEMCKHVRSHLEKIKSWGIEQAKKIKKFEEPLSGDVTNTEMIRNMETRVNEVEESYKEKNDELDRSSEILKPSGETDPLINDGLSVASFVESRKHQLDATFSPDSGIEMAQYQPDLNVVDVI